MTLDTVIEPDRAIADLQAEVLAWQSKAQDSEQLAINVIKALGTVNIERDNFIDYAEAVARTVKEQTEELTDLKQREEVKALAAQGTPRIETRVLHKIHSFPMIADDLTAALNSGWRVVYETFIVHPFAHTHIVRLEREVIDPVPAPKQEAVALSLWQEALDELPDSQPIVPIKQLVSVEAMLTAGEVGRSHE